MERPFNDAAMLHYIIDSLFRTDSPLHHEFSISLETFIAERIASRESQWFPCLSSDLHSCSQKLKDTQTQVIELEQRIDALQTTAASATAATDHQVDTLQSSTENATQAELSQCYALLNEFVRVSSQPPSNNFQFSQPLPQPQPQPQPPSSSNQPLYALPSSSPHPPQQPPPQPPVFDPHAAHQFAVQRAPTQEILGRRVERLNKLVKKFSGRPGSGEF